MHVMSDEPYVNYGMSFTGTLPEVSNPHNHTQQQEWPPRHENKKPKSFRRH